jgi:hypothetical protein
VHVASATVTVPGSPVTFGQEITSGGGVGFGQAAWASVTFSVMGGGLNGAVAAIEKVHVNRSPSRMGTGLGCGFEGFSVTEISTALFDVEG